MLTAASRSVTPPAPPAPWPAQPVPIPLSVACLYVNERWCELSGLNPQEALRDGWTRSVYTQKIANESWGNGIRKRKSRQGRRSSFSFKPTSEAIANYANRCAIGLPQHGANGSSEIIQEVGQISALSVRAGYELFRRQTVSVRVRMASDVEAIPGL